MDNICQVVTVLQQNNAGKEIVESPIYIEDLSTMKKSRDIMYFGVLTVGENVITTNLYTDKDNLIIKVQKNSQIIELFSYAEFLDAVNAPLVNPNGQFRGHEIQIR
ncbi:MAG: hypothetical protein KDC67_14635 [Ignavibacteriae bacterium]|nr:hypothetical protein [Ignavibacteriota bacterium]